jgi:hypothetical protein
VNSYENTFGFRAGPFIFIFRVYEKADAHFSQISLKDVVIRRIRWEPVNLQYEPEF